MKKNIYLLLVFSIFSLSHLFANEDPHRVYVGPIWQNLNSTWKNNTKQEGSMWGVTAGYDYIAKNQFYAGAEFDYAKGTVKGFAGNDPTTEYIGEGRVGYTYSLCASGRNTFTPFLGIGYYEFDQNVAGGFDFDSHFWYVPVGFRFEHIFSSSFKAGFRGTVGPTFGGRWKITTSHHAPTNVLWKAELPLTYTVRCGCSLLDLSLVPFFKEWAYKTDGGLIGQQNVYTGVNLQFGYSF